MLELTEEKCNITASIHKKKRECQKIEIKANKKIGRPAAPFDQSRAKQLISLGFNMSQVSNALGISAATLRRFRKQNKDCQRYDTISDDELDLLVISIKEESSQMGEKRLLALLKSKGITVQRKRLRDSIHRVDPAGPIKRRNKGIARVNARTNLAFDKGPDIAMRDKFRIKEHKLGIQVPANCNRPNSRWRCDSLNKLERWKIKVTFAIDMFSRFMTFAIATLNPHSSILNCFKSATEKYGFPEMLDIDEKEEKSEMREYMCNIKGDSSVELFSKLDRVQWIIVLKNDFNFNIFNNFIKTFTELEEEGALNHLNDTDLFCLYFVFIPRINRLLNDFTHGNSLCAIPHSNGVNPLQIYYAHNGAALSSSTDHIDMWQESVDMISLTSKKVIADKLPQLFNTIDPLEKSLNNGKDIYYKTRCFISKLFNKVFDGNTDIAYLTDGNITLQIVQQEYIKEAIYRSEPSYITVSKSEAVISMVDSSLENVADQACIVEVPSEEILEQSNPSKTHSIIDLDD